MIKLTSILFISLFTIAYANNATLTQQKEFCLNNPSMPEKIPVTFDPSSWSTPIAINNTSILLTAGKTDDNPPKEYHYWHLTKPTQKSTFIAFVTIWDSTQNIYAAVVTQKNGKPTGICVFGNAPLNAEESKKFPKIKKQLGL
jgi:hypothetical protein